MPPRHAYWTILIDDKPTAFRAREREELLPTFHQLQRKNTNVVMQWFARGRLWESQEREHEDFQRRKRTGGAPAGRSASAGGEKRAADWRPGGQHKDPRDRFKKKNRPERAWSDGDGSSARRDREKLGPPRSPDGQEARRSPPDRRASGGGWRDKPHGDRAWSNKPPTGGPRSDRPWRDKPPSGGPPSPDGREARRNSPDHRASGGGWSHKPAGGAPRSDRPMQNRKEPNTAAGTGGPQADRKPDDNAPRKRRDEDPDRD